MSDAPPPSGPPPAAATSQPAKPADRPFSEPPPPEPRIPRGCHPLVFGVVLATLQFAATLYFMPSCFGGGGTGSG